MIEVRTVPVGNVLVGDTGSDIEHDDTGLAVDVVTITETTELLLTSSVPDIELNGSQVLFAFALVTRVGEKKTGQGERDSERGSAGQNVRW